MDSTATTTREQLLHEAQHLIRLRGSNGFSYRDLADIVGVKTSSIHYYFPTKDDLVMEAISEYASRSAERRALIDPALPADQKLRRYIGSLECKVRENSLLCLGGALAADFDSVPKSVQGVIARFFADNERWIADVLRQGQAEGTLQVPGDPDVMGRILFAVMQGSTLTCRLFDDYSRMHELLQIFGLKPEDASSAVKDTG